MAELPSHWRTVHTIAVGMWISVRYAEIYLVILRTARETGLLASRTSRLSSLSVLLRRALVTKLCAESLWTQS